MTRRYPYLVYYTIDEASEEIVIIAIQHPAREREARMHSDGTLRRSSYPINLTIRHIPSRHVGSERRWIALSWIAVAATARRAE